MVRRGVHMMHKTFHLNIRTALIKNENWLSIYRKV